jgi:hypothetical protein
MHDPDAKKLNTDCYKFVGSCGSGNQAIAARVTYELSKYKYEKVIVMWSGINRLDFPIPTTLHQLQPKNNNGQYLYEYFTELDTVTWYHSGGFGASGTGKKCPSILRDWFKTQYIDASPGYLTDLTLSSIISTQAILKQYNIPTVMSFIYDIDRDYTNDAVFYVDNVCGKIDRSSNLMSLVDWSCFVNVLPPLEFARQTNTISKDGFHPTNDGLIDWFDKSLNINLTKISV